MRHAWKASVLAPLFVAGPILSQQIDAPRISDYWPEYAVNHVVSTNTGTNAFNGMFVNDTVLQANRWTSVGFTGTGATVANIEGGWAWASTAANPNRHQDLPTGRVTQFLAQGGAISTAVAFRGHATAVTHAIGGVGGSNFQKGMSSTSTLWTGNIATGFGGGGTFSTTFNSTLPLYRDVFRDGVATAGGAVAQIVNSSWGFTNPTGNDLTTAGIDAMVYQSRVAGVRGAGLFVVSAGNSGPNENTVGAPAAGFNGLVVGALGTDTSNPVYNTINSFSSRGRQSYFNPNGAGSTITLARNRVDISAPGSELTLAALVTDGVDGGSTSSYFGNAAGTSFSSPLTAGGASLLVGAGRNTLFTTNPDAVDGRVVKAVLMNSAVKTAGWTNSSSVVAGVNTTTEALDRATGAGRLNMSRAFDQYVPIANGGLAGTTDVAGLGSGNLGNVAAIGWDFGQVQLSGTITNDYILPTLSAGSNFSALLSWYANNSIDFGNSSGSFGHFLDLNLQLFTNNGGVAGTLVAESISSFNSSEHIFFNLPNIDQSYVLRVVFDSAETRDYNFDNTTSEFYGLAWSGSFAAIPEPTTIALFGVGVVGTLGYFYRRRQLANKYVETLERRRG